MEPSYSYALFVSVGHTIWLRLVDDLQNSFFNIFTEILQKIIGGIVTTPATVDSCLGKESYAGNEVSAISFIMETGA